MLNQNNNCKIVILGDYNLPNIKWLPDYSKDDLNIYPSGAIYKETQGEEGTEEVIFEGTLQELEEADLNDTVVMSPASTSTNNSEPCTSGVGRKRSCSGSLTPISKLAKDKRMELGKLIEASSMRLQAVNKLPTMSDHIDAFGASIVQEMRKIQDQARLRKLKRIIISAVFDMQDEETAD
ncbi:hypothetical protein FQR65_LT04336 [Abscondita terminalis]|nr:hypothetical protein FQR65_LT04336 [Abscondita terminalis]